MKPRMTTEEFIKRAKEKHGDWYDYSKVDYVNAKTDVIIICPKHGEFLQLPYHHLIGYGCPVCAGKNRNTEMFIEEAQKVHGNKYDHSKVNYDVPFMKVCINCLEHGEIWQTPGAHIHNKSGCSECVRNKKISTDEFVTKARKVHGDKYDYSKVDYVNAKTDVIIICPEHGEFLQSPDSHWRGCGCKKCGRKTTANKLSLSYEYCYECAKTCKTLKELNKKYPSVYQVSYKHKWINDFDWLERKQVQNNYYNDFERCKEKALICRTISEFKTLYGNAWKWSKENNWLDIFFPNKQKKNFWTEETALTEAKKYKSKTDFKNGCLSAYKYVSGHKLMNKCTWFKKPKKDNHLKVQEYIDECKKKYNGFYNYSHIDINNVNSIHKTKVPIECPEHGIFYQTLPDHLKCVYPCKKCRQNVRNKNNNDELKTIIEDKMEYGIIYSYKDKENGKMYIGRTIRPERRLRDHLRKNQKSKSLFDTVFQKKGAENFEYNILFEIQEKRSKIFSILNEKEKYFIKLFNTQVPNGYNISEGGGSIEWFRGYKPTQETIQKLKDSHKGLPNSMKGKHYSEEKKNEMVSKHKSSMAKKYADGFVQQRKYIIVFKNNSYLETYPNACEIERQLGIDSKRIYYVLNKRPLRKSVDDEDVYVFIYKEIYDDNLLNDINEKVPSLPQNIKSKRGRCVRQFNKDGEEVKIMKLSEATKIFGDHVADVCNGKRNFTHGFKFEWVE